jgi:hypothetical protein
VINDPKLGSLFFWFFFVVTIAWTVIAVAVRAYRMLKKNR